MEIKEIVCAEQAPIFICGPKRSGSTMLRRIINTHSQITMPSPEWLFHFVYMHLYSYGNLNEDANIRALVQDCLDVPMITQYWSIEETADEILSLLPERSFRGVYVTLFMLKMKEAPTPFWGAKTPSNVFWTRELHEMFPKAKFIFLHRDGRDVTIDQVAADWGPFNLYNACWVWLHYSQAVLKAKTLLPSHCIHEIYYENLVSNPNKEIQALCKFMNVDFEPGMLEFNKQKSDSFLSLAHHAKASKPITDQYVGIYKTLPEPDRQLQVALMGETLRQLDYKIEDTPRDFGFWESKWYIEEDEYGGTITDGGPQYKRQKRTEREQRKENGVWDDNDRIHHFQG